jgi:uncharacterized OB-fold protein
MFGAAAAVVAAVAAIEAHRRQSKGEFAPHKEDLPAITKCPSCGSHQFVMHASRRICSYCRSEG